MHPWAYKSDIKSFFDNIPRERLIKETVGVLRTRSLNPLIVGAIECEIDDRLPVVKRRLKRNGIERGDGVRQGMPLSSLFANVILRKFDKALMKRGIHVVRYADDFVILADSGAQCLEIDGLVRRLLEKIELDIPALGANGKTQVVPPDVPVEFLGLALAPTTCGYQLLITEAQLNKVRRDMGQLKDPVHLTKLGADVSGVSRIIQDKIGGYLGAYKNATNKRELDRVLQEVRRNIFHGIYGNIFGEHAIRSLTRPHRRFLCLEEVR